MTIEINSKVFVSSNASSAYHKMHGDEVIVIGIHDHPSANIDDKVITFIHPEFGPGALYSHGLKNEYKYSYAGEWGKDESLKKAMFTKFVGEKKSVEVGRSPSAIGEVITLVHPQLGFIAATADELHGNVYQGTR